MYVVSAFIFTVGCVIIGNYIYDNVKFKKNTTIIKEVQIIYPPLHQQQEQLRNKRKRKMYEF